MSEIKKSFILMLIFFADILFSILIVMFLLNPLIYISFINIICSGILFSLLKKKSRWISINLFFIFVFLFLLETYSLFLLSEERGFFSSSTSYGIPDYFQDDKILGYKIKALANTVATKRVNNEEIYKVKYSIDKLGRRITAYKKKDHYNSSIIFFGCSFTFGEGVNDEESLPFIVQTFFPEKFNVYNYGVHGYGPHHMLAFLENGDKNEIREKPQYIFHISLPDHVERVMNLTSWSKKDPSYRLVDGKILLIDKKDLKDENQDNMTWYFTNRIFRKFTVIQYLKIRKEIEKKTSPRVDNLDDDTFIAVIEKSAEIIKRKYGIKLDVIFWNFKGDKSRSLLIKLEEIKNIRIHLIADIIPDIFENKSKYIIRENVEIHPNGYTYLKIAEYMRDFVNNRVLVIKK